MGVTISIPRNVMLGMISEYYLSEYAFLKPQKLVALDEIVFKLWYIDGKVHPSKWLVCGIVCFEEGRSKKQVFTALKAADRTYNLPEYEVWCHPNTLGEARAVVRKLPPDTRGKTTIHSITKIWNPPLRGKLLLYAAEILSDEAKDTDVYWEIKEAVAKYGLAFVAVFDVVRARIEQVLLTLRTEDYSVEEALRKEAYVIYRVRKAERTEPVRCDLVLAEIKKLTPEQWKELDAKMLTDFAIVDDTNATDEDREILNERIRYLLNKIPNEAPTKSEVFTEVSPSKIDGRKSLAAGLEYQRRVTDACDAKDWIIEPSMKRGEPDILRLDERSKVIMVIAVKSYSLEVTIRGKSCRNCKGHKYMVSFKASRDAKAEVKAARENGLNQIWLICGNLKTGRTIHSGYVGFEENVKLRER